MACKEIAALRLSLRTLLSGKNIGEDQKIHDLMELGEDAKKPGPLKSLAESENFDDLLKLFSHCVSELQDKLGQEQFSSPQQKAYYQSLLIVNKKIEMDLLEMEHTLQKFLDNLDHLHHFIHEVHPQKL